MDWKDKEQVKLYDARYYREHKQKWREYERNEHHQEWRRQNMEKIRISRRKAVAKFYQRLRQEIFTMFGRRCVYCGYDTDDRAFQIDHINGGGSADRKSFNSNKAYYQHILNCEGKGYQLLCANCNQIKAHENGEFQITKRKRDDNIS